MKTKHSIAIYFLLLSLSAYADSEPQNIVVFSKSKSNPTHEITLTQNQYSQKLQTLLSQVNSNVTETLSTRENETQNKLKLKAVMVGIGLEMKAGFGPIAEAKVTPRIRLVFTRRDSSFFPEAD